MEIKFRADFINLTDERVLGILVNSIDIELSKFGIVYIQQGNYFCEGFIDLYETEESRINMVKKIKMKIEQIDKNKKIKNCG